MMDNLNNYMDEAENRDFFHKAVLDALREIEVIKYQIHDQLKTANSQNSHKVAEKVLKLVEESNNIFNNLYTKIKSAYEKWFNKLSVSTATKENIIEINSDSEEEIHIVNEIKYLNPRKRIAYEKVKVGTWYSTKRNENDSSVHVLESEETENETCDVTNHDLDYFQEGEIIDNKNYVNNIESSLLTNDEKSLLINKETNHIVNFEKTLVKNEINCLSSDESNHECSSETNTCLNDEKLKLKCVVTLEKLSNKQLDKIKNTKLKIRVKKLSDKEFERYINLDKLEKRKRYHESESDSSSENSTIRSYRKKKKFKINSDESDVSSYYESSNDSNNDESHESTFSDTNIHYGDSDEEFIKQKLCKSYSLEDSEDDSDIISKDSDSENEQKNDIKKTKSHISHSPKYDFDTKNRAEWKDDYILNFRLQKSNVQNNKKSDKKNGNTNDLMRHKKKSRKNKNPYLEESWSDSDSIFTESDDECIITEDSKKSEDLLVSNNFNSISTIIDLFQSKSQGRKNIRKVLDDQEITVSTKQAGKNEENRIQRLTERSDQLKAIQSRADLTKDEESLVLDYDFKTKKEIVTVDKGLVKFLKPHQKSGVKFMWDACFETLERTNTTEGSGCILAHCMGLGKTFQIITLAHTVLTNDNIKIKTIMVVCPKNIILNWFDEFETWIKRAHSNKTINIYELTKKKKSCDRINTLISWTENGGVLILSYDMLRNLITQDGKLSPMQSEKVKECLINPGANIVVCDEGHLLKSDTSLIASIMQTVRSKRRITLTGTPLQNNLKEYLCMVHFVKPNLLGTKKEFLNRFVNPINNGQFDDSTPNDVNLMKKRAHVLHKMLENSVQRCDYEVLTPFLPPKQEYVIMIRLAPPQEKMYQHYVDTVIGSNVKGGLLKHYHEIKRLIAHPFCLFLNSLEKNKKNNYKTMKNLQTDLENISVHDCWWHDFISERLLKDNASSYKMELLFKIISKCEEEGDKMLVFSRSMSVLNAIENYLMIPIPGSGSSSSDQIELHKKWVPKKDFFRLDGKIDSESRNRMCKEFNDPSNKRARLFLISTKAGALGINLTGANRVIIFDPSWNPSDDVQSIFRVYRFGQKKTCYIYRFLGAGTMEENIYNRQVTKLSLSLRVVDEQQVERHFKNHELQELYRFKKLDSKQILNVPKDRILADIFTNISDQVYDFFEHNSLLQNKQDEELTAEELMQAWADYKKEKENEVNKIKNKENDTADKKQNEVDNIKNKENDTADKKQNEVNNIKNKEIDTADKKQNEVNNIKNKENDIADKKQNEVNNIKNNENGTANETTAEKCEINLEIHENSSVFSDGTYL